MPFGQNGVGPTIDNPTNLPLSSEANNVLQIMFSSYHRLTIEKEFPEGLSGSQVFLVRPIKSEHSPDLPAVVKIAPASMIRREWRAFQDCVYQKLPGIAEITGEPITPPASLKGGLRYTLMGEGGTFEIESLHSYCDRASIADICYVLKDRLFETAAPHWWLFNEAKAAWPVRASYDFLLPVNLLITPAPLPPDTTPHPLRSNIFPSSTPLQGDYVRLEGFIVTEVDSERKAVTLNVPAREDGLPASYRLRLEPVESVEHYQVGDEIAPIEGRVTKTRYDQLRDFVQNALEHHVDLTIDTLASPNGTPLPNPLTALPTLLGKTRNVRVSCIHGDLNMENILVEPVARTVSLIDFATARRDHALHDLLRLETEVIAKLLPGVLTKSDLFVETLDVFFQRLDQATFAPGQPASTQPPQVGLDKAFQMLVAIRKMARQCMFDPNDEKEYYEGLTLYLLGALKFKNLDRQSKQIAFWAAAVVYNLVAPVPSKRPPTSKDWGRLQRYLPAEMFQEKQEALCLRHLNALLRAVLTYLPRHLALDLLRESLVAQNQGQFLQGTLLFADISDFTAMSEKLRQKGEKEGAEEVARIINEYLDVMLVILFKYSGRLIKFGGDAMLCLFTGEDQGAMNAVWAAWEMKQAMADRFGEIKVLHEVFPLEMKAGGNSGLLFAATVGTAEHMEYVLTGSAVERTARAESAAGKGDILVSHETYTLVKENLEVEKLAEKPDFYRVTGVRSELPSQADDPWSVVEGALSLIENDLWEVVDRLDALSPYLPAGVLPQLVYDPQGGQIEGQHRQVTVLFANFIGMGEIIHARGIKDAAGIAADLSEYFRAMQEEVRYYGGVVNKVDLYDQGDKLMVIFGAPQAHEKDTQRAALTALAMQNAMSRLSPATAMLLSQRIGIHSGSVFAGNVGSSECNRREYTVMGDTVNVAARLMSGAPRGQVWASERVWDQIQGEFEAKSLAPITVKGISDPIVVYKLEATRGVQEGRAWSRVLDSDMVGRDAELQSLMAHVRDLSDGAGKQIVAITGEAGVGKTRLIEEWQRRISESVPSPSTGLGTNSGGGSANQQTGEGAATWLSGRGRSYGQKAHGVFIEILEGLLAFSDADTQDERWAKLSDRVKETFVDPEPGWLYDFSNQLACLGQFLALDLSQRPGLTERIAQLEAETLLIQTRLALCDLLIHAAQKNPLILLLEDLHWADDASLDMLRFVLDRVSDDAPMLFCLIFRPKKEHTIWGTWQEIDRSHPGCHLISLRELGDTYGRQLLFNLLRTSQLPDDFQTLVLDETDGNPLYVEEALHALIEDGVIVQDEEGWQITRSVERIRVPDTLCQIIQSRVDELDFGSPGARRLLWMAAVIGEEFTEELLRHLFTSTGRREQELSSHLRELRNAAMIKKSRLQKSGRSQWGYRFQHGLVQQVAYENMLVEKRREYHGEVGRWLEQRYSDDLPRHYDTLAHHYDQGQQWEKAFRYCWLAGQKDAQAFANQDAASHLVRALEIANYIVPTKDTLARIHFELGKVFVTLGRFDDAIAHLEDSYDLLEGASELNTVLRKAQVCYQIGYAYQLKGGHDNLTSALAWRDRGLASLSPDPTAEAALLHVMGGFVAFRRSDFAQAVQEGREALRLAEAVDSQSALGVIHRLLSVAYHAQGHLDLAMLHCERGIQVDQQVGDLSGELKGYLNHGVFAFEMDNWPLTRASYLKSIDLIKRVGDKYELGKAYVNLGDLYSHLGEIERGFEYARQALDIFIDVQAVPGMIIARTVLATLFWRQRELDQALAQLSEARELAGSAVMFKPTVGRWLAQVYLTQGDMVRAEAEIQALLSLDVDVLADEAEPIQHLRGEILAAQGKSMEALEVLRASLERLERKQARYQKGLLLLALAWVLKQTDELSAQARPIAERARVIFADLGAKLDVQAVDELLAELKE
jgi:class 3 adenylate cyclase/tetratricopeptide (TPR) repeat protein